MTPARTTRIAGDHFFDSAAVENLISDYQRTACTETLGEIIIRCQPIALSLIHSKFPIRTGL
jgi:hypothetical protein